MDRVFLDANVLFSAAYSPASGLKQLWTLARAHKVELLASTYVVEEARRNLEQDPQRARLERLLLHVEISDVSEPAATLRLPARLAEKDKPVLAAAITMDASHLLTGDITHFGDLYGERIKGVLVLMPGDYLRLR